MNAESESGLEDHKREKKRANEDLALVVRMRKGFIKEMTFTGCVRIWQTEKALQVADLK